MREGPDGEDALLEARTAFMYASSEVSCCALLSSVTLASVRADSSVPL
jgi:hypothetical protein